MQKPYDWTGKDFLSEVAYLVIYFALESNCNVVGSNEE